MGRQPVLGHRLPDRPGARPRGGQRRRWRRPHLTRTRRPSTLGRCRSARRRSPRRDARGRDPGRSTSSHLSIQTVDPAFYTSANNPQFTGLAYDSLVNFEQTTGAAGLRLVPDLAVSIPAPSDGGRTYAFRIRPGIRYSDGQPLRAGDFRRGVERLFRVRSPGAFLYGDLVGAGACEARPGTLQPGAWHRHRRRRPARSPFTSPRPIPSSSSNSPSSASRRPSRPARPTTKPGRGPCPAPARTRSSRSPRPRSGSSATRSSASGPTPPNRPATPTRSCGAASPASKPGWPRSSGERPTGCSANPGRPVHQLQIQHPDQLHINPQFAVNFVALNTHAAPFNSLLVRQALNDAINRATIVAALRRAGLRPPDLPGDRPRHPRLPPLLPLHAAPPRRRRLERP